MQTIPRSQLLLNGKPKIGVFDGTSWIGGVVGFLDSWNAFGSFRAVKPADGFYNMHSDQMDRIGRKRGYP